MTYEPVGRLVGYARNAKIHTAEQVEQIKKSIEEFGFNDPIGVWTNEEGKSEVVEGHGRLIAARELGMETVPVVHLDSLTDEQRRAYTHVHNQLTMNTGNDDEILSLDLEDLGGFFDFGDFGFEIESEQDDETPEEPESTSLADRFGVAPLSVLDARKGEWMERKHAWMALGIRSELGRGAAPGGHRCRSIGGVLGSPTTSTQGHRRTGSGTLGAIAPNQKHLFEIMKGR